jgi:FkbM family methyltransferase
MHFDYIDIGTCDFETSIDNIDQSNTKNILLVEPLKYYLDKLPNYPGVIKDNVGISNRDGTIRVFYLPDSIIELHKLPVWLRGCSSIGCRHIVTDYHLAQRNLSLDLVETKDVDIITFDTLCKKHNVESIGTLKIDTEGHEQYILPDILEKINRGFVINKIKFENQEYLGNKSFLDYLTDKFVQLGYIIVEKTINDVTLELNYIEQQVRSHK